MSFHLSKATAYALSAKANCGNTTKFLQFLVLILQAGKTKSFRGSKGAFKINLANEIIKNSKLSHFLLPLNSFPYSINFS